MIEGELSGDGAGEVDRGRDEVACAAVAVGIVRQSGSILAAEIPGVHGARRSVSGAMPFARGDPAGVTFHVVVEGGSLCLPAQWNRQGPREGRRVRAARQPVNDARRRQLPPLRRETASSVTDICPGMPGLRQPGLRR